MSVHGEIVLKELEHLIDYHKINDHCREIPIRKMINNMPTVLVNRKLAALSVCDRLKRYMEDGEKERASCTIPGELWCDAEETLYHIYMGREEEGDLRIAQAFIEVGALLHLVPDEYNQDDSDIESTSMEDDVTRAGRCPCPPVSLLSGFGGRTPFLNGA